MSLRDRMNKQSQGVELFKKDNPNDIKRLLKILKDIKDNAVKENYKENDGR